MTVAVRTKRVAEPATGSGERIPNVLWPDDLTDALTCIASLVVRETDPATKELADKLAEIREYVERMEATGHGIVVPTPAEASASAFANALRREVRNRLVHLAESGAPLEHLGRPEEVAEQWAAMLPLAPSPLKELTGPFYDTTGLRSWLGVTRQALDSRVRHQTLLVLTTGDGSRVYPAWQWRPDKSTIPHLAEVLQPLLRGARDPWTVALWMSTPVDWGSGEKMAAWKWLDHGRNPQPVLDEARADSARWVS